MMFRMKPRTACMVLFYILSAVVGGVFAQVVGLQQPVVGVVANVCAIATMVWMTTTETGKKMKL
jgi:hypothetical protein